MHLKSIEMVGFKSFADRTEIDLKEGVSAIVGPNGCGKSNIVDAIRWCLGEMSPRSLRSKQMLDVIFAGAAGRAAVNLSEVILTFDNSHHLLPIDYTEVQVSRKLFRSGESEYFLNKTQCRLKDIRDLFLDTGLSEGYSIMAQGEVDFVMNAKPEERRELFEEAAGISKYKARREEASRRLERVEIDINRLNDVITLVKEQMDALESAAKKARQYQKLRDELKAFEITDFVNQLNKLTEEIQIHQKRMEELRDQLQKAQTDLDCAEAQLLQDRLAQDEDEKHLFTQQSAILDLDRQINLSDNNMSTAREREEESRQRIQKGDDQIDQLQKEHKEIENKIKAAQSIVDSAEERVNILKDSFEKEKECWESLKMERKDLESGKNEISDLIFTLQSEISLLESEKNKNQSLTIHKQSDVLSSKKQLDKNLQEQAALNEEISKLNQTIVKLQQSFGQHDKDICAIQEQLIEKERRQNELSTTFQHLHHTVIEKESQLSYIQNSFESNPYRRGTQMILKQGFPGLKGIVGLIFKYSENVGQWVESVLGNKMNYLVFEHLSEAQDALNWLKENRLGRATCIVLDKIPTVSLPVLSSVPNANSLLSFVQCAPELDTLKKYLLGSAFLSGSTLYDTGTIDGGSDLSPVEPRSSEAEQAQNNSDTTSFTQNQFLLIENLHRDIQSAKDEKISVGRELSDLHHEITGMKENRTGHSNVLENIRMKINLYSDLLKEKNDAMDICSRTIALDNEKVQSDEKELTELAANIKHSEDRVHRLSETKTKKEKEREEFSKKTLEKQEQEHRSEVVSKEHEIRLETFLAQLSKDQESLDQWKRHKNQSEKTMAELTKDIESCKSKIKEFQKIQKDETHNIDRIQSEKTKIASGVEELLLKKSEWEQRNNQSLSHTQGLRETQNQLSSVLHHVEIDLRTSENESKNIAKRLDESYQLTPEQAREQASAQTVDAEEIARLRKRVESMSHSVNLEAPEQHQQLEERYNFQYTQFQDLIRAKDDLKKTIQQINATTKEQFKETFAKVRENFRTVFSTLFEGGEADLIFTNEQEVLDTGIDIVAQPAGKKLQNIALLSGGEKALTAISLLFAFFMVKPSPFCVLDEVDAPWDPANVNRFLNLLKQFSQNTQFLVVTHNPRTMEIADILYGVTMEEFGISKILSTRLKKEPSRETADLAAN